VANELGTSRIDFGPLGFVDVIKGSFAEAVEYMSKSRDTNVVFKDDDPVDGFVVADAAGGIVVWFDDDICEYETIAHESVHVAQHLFNRAGLQIDIRCGDCMEHLAIVVGFAAIEIKKVLD
jgi:hypothetical protein